MFSWNKINDNVAIHCKTEEEANAFLQGCEKHGIKWCTGEKPTSTTVWTVAGVNTNYYISNKYISAGNLIYSKRHNYTILEWSDLCKPDLPRICYILGGEDNPLKIGEHFQVKGYGVETWVGKSGLLEADLSAGNLILEDMLYTAINSPDSVIRSPQFSDDEKALMRLYVDAGFPIFHRNEDGALQARNRACTNAWMFPPEILPNLTISVGEFDAATYLESEAKDDG